jgi:hypothetical protein
MPFVLKRLSSISNSIKKSPANENIVATIINVIKEWGFFLNLNNNPIIKRGMVDRLKR